MTYGRFGTVRPPVQIPGPRPVFENESGSPNLGSRLGSRLVTKFRRSMGQWLRLSSWLVATIVELVIELACLPHLQPAPIAHRADSGLRRRPHTLLVTRKVRSQWALGYSQKRNHFVIRGITTQVINAISTIETGSSRTSGDMFESSGAAMRFARTSSGKIAAQVRIAIL